ncbi:MAG: tyrosine-type recombinase/integrase [Pirellulales bacterium]|nr:tyrosine-type recombinase/integrase [Pirellulales bacterium]
MAQTLEEVDAVTKSTLPPPPGKVHLKYEKPSPNFPLFPHATGRWAKKIRGKLVYFGRMADDPTGIAAIAAWQKYNSELLAGRGLDKAKPRRRAGHPEKPYPEFPLFAHATKRWAKKIRGKLVYFGPWDDPEGALAKYLEQKDDLHAGRVPRVIDGTTIKDAVNAFLDVKEARLTNGELSPRSFRDYHATCARLVEFFGRNRLVDDIRSDDFGRLRIKLSKTLGAVSLGNEIQRVRTVFKFAYDDGLIERPLRFGQSFAKPARSVIRKARASSGARMFEAEEIRKLIDEAGTPLKAMVLLAINCGFGQSDIAELPLSAVDLTTGWIDFPRPKTGVPRRCPLWPETVKALKSAIKNRPEPADNADGNFVFLTTFGRRWVRTKLNAKGGIISVDSVLLEFKKIIVAADVTPHGFYALRHSFRTAADGARDQIAVGLIMGHHDESMAGVYRERVEEARLKAVTDHVRRWLWPRGVRKAKAK